MYLSFIQNNVVGLVIDCHLLGAKALAEPLSRNDVRINTKSCQFRTRLDGFAHFRSLKEYSTV